MEEIHGNCSAMEKDRGGKVRDLTQSELDMIESIIEKFDFEKAHALFVTMGWTYYDEPTAPTVKMLKSAARGVLTSVLERPSSTWCESGRFMSVKTDEDLTLKLIFEDAEVSING